MNTVIAPHDVLLPRAPGGNGPGALLALLVHGGLIVALSISVDWRSPPSEIVAAELWSAVPQVAAPPSVAPPALPPALPPTPAPRVEPPAPRAAPAPADADIAVEKAKARKAAEDKERAERTERERQARLKAERDRAEREKAQREQAERERAERDAEDRRIAQQREENLRRMRGQMESGTGAPGARGTASVDAAPSQTYAGRLRAAIFPNIVFTETYSGNPETEVEVRAAPNGAIIARRIVKPSGNRDWDEAVLKAIDRTATLPRDTDGRVPAALTITFRPTKS